MAKVKRYGGDVLIVLVILAALGYISFIFSVRTAGFVMYDKFFHLAVGYLIGVIYYRYRSENALLVAFLSAVIFELIYDLTLYRDTANDGLSFLQKISYNYSQLDESLDFLFTFGGVFLGYFILNQD